ncbi:MAG: site-specific DNA-methyltransferase [Gudongella sp.]|nr:site-specific DNA-methyltransferase [Gudongella sp.]
MSGILDFKSIIEDSRSLARDLMDGKAAEMTVEHHGEDVLDNRLYLGDNLDAMLHLLGDGMKGKIDLVYIDPPFFSGADYKRRITVGRGEERLVFYNHAYGDIWEEGISEYLRMISVRLFLMRDLLSDRGTIYVHVDGRTSHYLRLILDQVFGKERFLNEIIWSYKSGGAGRRSFSKKHDNILVYTKTKDYIFNPQREKSYNRGMKPYRFKNVAEYQDDIGWYTMVNMKDVWTLDMVGRTSSERVGYETQKPESLLERIVRASSDEGSIVADFFMGSGTTIKVARDLVRGWIGADSSIHSIVTCKRRIGPSEGLRLCHRLVPGDSRLDFKARASRKGEALELSIENMRLDSEAIGKDASDPDLAIRLLKERPQTYIDYLGLYGIKDNIETIGEWYGQDVELGFLIEDFPRKYDRIMIRMIDIFGNIAERELEV